MKTTIVTWYHAENSDPISYEEFCGNIIEALEDFKQYIDTSGAATYEDWFAGFLEFHIKPETIVTTGV